MSLLELEKKYQDYLSKQYKALYTLYNNIKLDASLTLKTNDITKAILLRMKAFSDTNNVFCKLKFLTFANIFPQAPVGNFFVNYNESARHFVLS